MKGVYQILFYDPALFELFIRAVLFIQRHLNVLFLQRCIAFLSGFCVPGLCFAKQRPDALTGEMLNNALGPDFPDRSLSPHTFICS